MKYEILIGVILFIILFSLQLTLNKIVVLLKMINIKMDNLLRIKNEDENEI